MDFYWWSILSQDASPKSYHHSLQTSITFEWQHSIYCHWDSFQLTIPSMRRSQNVMCHSWMPTHLLLAMINSRNASIPFCCSASELRFCLPRTMRKYKNDFQSHKFCCRGMPVLFVAAVQSYQHNYMCNLL